MHDPLSALLSLSESVKQSRGLADTPREIAQQPETWLRTLERLSTFRHQLAALIGDFLKVDERGRSAEVILVGAGTSDYIGRAVSRLLRQQWRCPVFAVPSTELLTNLEDLILPDNRYLFVSVSRSGDSSEGVAVMEQTLERYPHQIQHLLITCNEEGAMARLPGVFSVALDRSVNDRGLAMTSSFSNMVLAAQYLAFVDSPRIFEPRVAALAEMGSQLLPAAATIAAGLARGNFGRVCFLGTGCLEAVAQESGLKVLELNAGRMATVAQSALGLRHGPLSFVDDETLIVAYLSGDELRAQYELDLLEEMREKRLGAEMLIVAPRESSRIHRLTKNTLTLNTPPDFPDWCRPALDVIAGQLLGLFFAIENGITPDSPSAGAISRVVTHVKIYDPAGRKA